MKRKFSALIVIALMLSSFQVTMAYTYYADILGHWGESYIEWSTNEASLFQGYEDNTFKPDNNITRAEFISILNRLLETHKLNPTRTHNDFTLNYNDLNESFWAHNDIYEFSYYLENETQSKTNIKSILNGDSFHPNRPITRYEAGVLVSLITSPPIETSSKRYDDLSTNLTFYKEIINLTSNGIVNGYEDNTFRPNNNITRAESAKIIKEAFKEMEYIKSNQLHIRGLENFNLNNKRPMFEYGNESIGETELDRTFNNAVTTLDYMSFVGYIPHSEKHLYDTAPIGSLWGLKNSNYYNVIGVNYYLLKYDKSLVNERKIELVRESFEHYENSNRPGNINGMVEFLDKAKDIVSFKEFTDFAYKYFNDISNNDKIYVGTLLVEEYVKNNKYKDALSINEQILKLNTNTENKLNMIINNGYLLYEDQGISSATNYLKQSWEEVKKDTEYRNNKEEIDLLFYSIIKQILMKKN